jgi:choline-glycine betaine transporter
VHALIIVRLVAPAFFPIICMTIFGRLAPHAEMATRGLLKHALDQTGPDPVLDSLTFSVAVVVFLLLLSFLSYVTAADPTNDLLTGMTRRRRPEDGKQARTFSRHTTCLVAGRGPVRVGDAHIFRYRRDR